jgi:hypothetical protein
MLTSVNLLTSTIASDYSRTLAKLERLTSHREITSDLFYAILIPLSLMVARCAITGLPRIFKLTSLIKHNVCILLFLISMVILTPFLKVDYTFGSVARRVIPVVVLPHSSSPPSNVIHESEIVFARCHGV